jgi:hypothetical protein
MPKYDLIAEEIKWCEAHRNPEQMVYQDGFIAGLYHALWLMKSRPTPLAVDWAKAGSERTVVAKFEDGKLVSERVIRPTTKA